MQAPSHLFRRLGPDRAAVTSNACSAGRLVAVVATHNRCGQLRRTVARLLAEPAGYLTALVVVDNASDDGTAAFLDSISDPRLNVLRLAENCGGAGGFAAGLDFARRQMDPDWYLIMDDDAWPEAETLARFHSSAPGQWDALAGAVYDPKGQICDINRPTFDPFATLGTFIRTARKGREGFHVGPAAYEAAAPVAVDGASFVGLFLSREGLALAGLPDGGLFVYGDDALLTLRLSRAGGRIAFCPLLRFAHDHPSARNAQIGKPMWKIYYQHRNALILYRYAAGWLFWPICLVVIPRWALRIRAYPGRRRQFLRLYLRGIVHGLRCKTAVAHAAVLDWSGQPPRV